MTTSVPRTTCVERKFLLVFRGSILAEQSGVRIQRASVGERLKAKTKFALHLMRRSVSSWPGLLNRRVPFLDALRRVSLLEYSLHPRLSFELCRRVVV